VVEQWCSAHDYDEPGKPTIAWNDEQARAELVDALVGGAHRLLGHLPEQQLGAKAGEALALLALIAGQERFIAWLTRGNRRVRYRGMSHNDHWLHHRAAAVNLRRTILQRKARAANARLLDTERVGEGCVLASPAFERVALTSVTAAGRRAPAPRFGDPRVMALVGALGISLNNVIGFTNRSLRAQVSALLGEAYTGNQMSYDLGRLRDNGIITRIESTNTYLLTTDGQRVAIFYTKPHNRLLRPLLAANAPPAPLELRQALATIDRHIGHYISQAGIGNAARKLKININT
jgi:hypothetical protein